MRYIATILLICMILVFVVCGFLLWKRRHEPNDYSRTIQALLSWMSAFFALTFIFRTWDETTTSDGAFFEPEHTFVPLLMQMTFFLYPLEVIRPVVSRVKVYALLFSPLLLLVLMGMCAGIEYTPILTYADLWAHLGEFNVWFRLFTLIVMLFYAFSLFLVPYDWRHSSADRKFIRTYALGFCLIGVLHFTIQFTHAYVLVLLHQVTWMAFFFGVAYYELRERLLPHPADGDATPVCSDDDNDLWHRITDILENQEGWRNPNMNLTLLTEQVFSNRTYVNTAFKQHTGLTFGEYITKRRIDYVVTELRRNPTTEIHGLFVNVGYRQRSTAWRNFQKTMGMSPTEFLDTLT